MDGFSFISPGPLALGIFAVATQLREAANGQHGWAKFCAMGHTEVLLNDFWMILG